MDTQDKLKEMELEETESLSYAVESSCSIKSSVRRNPIKFKLLECDSDINLVPNNWLGSLEGGFALDQAMYRTKGFDSFRIAYMFPECLANVDIVSNSENIKKILTLPELPNSVINMIVHKIGNALLLDEIDTNNYLFSNDNSWRSFRSFILEKCRLSDLLSINTNKQILLPEFIYKSIKPLNREDDFDNIDSTNKPQSNRVCNEMLPEPIFEDIIPDYTYSHPSVRNVVWSFDGIQMLVGANMHIFEGFNRPCVSLRLNDIAQPFSPTTGKEYWLDNLMSNVPEVLICHHFQGAVQKYELIKTEDLPRLKNSEFETKLTGNTANKIFSDLKKLATESSHTYWLFKGKDDDNLTLYDLTDACLIEDNCNINAPFNIPIGLLQYTFAKSMLSQPNTSSLQKTTIIEESLKSCIKLLSFDKYPEILASAHLMLSEIYIPKSLELVIPAKDESENNSGKLSVKESTTMNKKTEYNISIDQSCNKLVDDQLENLETDLLERCQRAFTSIFDGLNSLKKLTTEAEKELKKNEEKVKCEEAFKTPQGNMRNAMFEEACLSYIDEMNSSIINSWGIHLKILLIQKAYLTYRIQAELELKNMNFGSSLRCFYNAFRCHLFVIKYDESIAVKNCYLFARAADCFFGLFKYLHKIDQFLEDYQCLCIADTTIMASINDDLDSNVNEVILHPVKNVQLVMGICSCLFDCALSFATPKERLEILHRFGVATNDFSLKLMLLAQEEYGIYMKTYSKESEIKNTDKENYQLLAIQSYDYLIKSNDCFKETNDNIKLGLLASNIGNYMLFRGNIHFKGEIPGNIIIFYKFYREGIFYYKRALSFIKSRQNEKQLWDSIHWDLTSANFSIFQKGFDHTSTSDYVDIDLLNETLDLLHESLKLSKCHSENAEKIKNFYVFRQGIINKKIGILYYAKIRTCKDTPAAFKKHIQLSKTHFEKSLTIFENIKAFNEVLCVQIERIVLHEFLAYSTKNKGNQIRYLKESLDICLKTKSVFDSIVNNEKATTIDLLETITQFESRIQFTLKYLLKLTLTEKSKDNSQGSCYKQMYQHTFNSAKYTDVILFSQYMSETLAKLIKINRKIK